MGERTEEREPASLPALSPPSSLPFWAAPSRTSPQTRPMTFINNLIGTLPTHSYAPVPQDVQPPPGNVMTSGPQAPQAPSVVLAPVRARREMLQAHSPVVVIKSGSSSPPVRQAIWQHHYSQAHHLRGL